MPKYRKKPVVIDAEQFHSTDAKWPVGVINGKLFPFQAPDGMSCTLPHIQTLEGHMLVSEGDWIITGVKGEVYPCKPDIFSATYELA